MLFAAKPDSIFFSFFSSVFVSPYLPSLNPAGSGLENVTVEARTSSEPPEASPVHSQSQQQPSQQQSSQQPLQQQQQQAQQYREAQVPRPSQQPSTPEKPAWGYGLDLIGSQASAFWQNYQGQLLDTPIFLFSVLENPALPTSSSRSRIREGGLDSKNEGG